MTQIFDQIKQHLDLSNPTVYFEFFLSVDNKVERHAVDTTSSPQMAQDEYNKIQNGLYYGKPVIYASWAVGQTNPNGTLEERPMQVKIDEKLYSLILAGPQSGDPSKYIVHFTGSSGKEYRKFIEGGQFRTEMKDSSANWVPANWEYTSDADYHIPKADVQH